MKTNKPAEPSPEVAPMQLDCHCRCFRCKDGKHCDWCIERGPVPAVAPRETQEFTLQEAFHAGFQACKELALSIVDEHDGYYNRVNDLDASLNDHDWREGGH